SAEHDLDRPARLLARPGGGDDPVAEPDPLFDPRLTGGVADVAEDRRAVGDRLRVHPGPEPVAERVHVGVGPDPWVAEQVPGATDRVARLENRVRLPGAALLQVVGGADTGEAGADDQDVSVFGLQALLRHSTGFVAIARVPSPGSLCPRAAAL